MNSILRECRILIVDDDQASVRLLTRILQTAGYLHVKGITDSREALAARESWRPDLIVLDLHMPHIDGLSLLQTFPARTASAEFVPVLVLTADTTRDTLKRTLYAGANDFLTKPLDVDEVLLRVRNLLAIRLSHEGLKNDNVVLAEELRLGMRFTERQSENRRARIGAIRSVIERRPTMVFQPVVELATRRVVGIEALARFDGGTTPDHWFAEATSLGLGTELELAAVSAALDYLDRLDSPQFMAVNVSPNVLLDRRLHDVLRTQGQGRVVVEITEHQPVESYDDLKIVRGRLRRDGIRVAIDDAGAGYASLHHILKLAPDIIKLDIGLTRDIDRDPIKRALATSLVQFASESDSIVTAEGIETASELDALRNLAVPWGQVFHLGYPAPFGERAPNVTRVG